jgi:hypothetical protein
LSCNNAEHHGKKTISDATDMKSLEEKFEMDESLMKEHDDGNITEELSAEKSKTLLQGKGDPLNDREKKEQSDEENYILPAPKLA